MNLVSSDPRFAQPRRRFVSSILAAAAGVGAACAARVGRAAESVAVRAGGGAQLKRYVMPHYAAGVEDLPDDIYGDLLMMRKGGANMMMGGSSTTVEPIASVDEWRLKAAALREIFDMTLGTAPLQDCPLNLRIDGEKDRGTVIERRVSYLLSPGERVTSLLLIPKGLHGPRPALLTIHPTTALGKEQTVGRGETENGAPTATANRRAYGLHLAEKGYVTFSPDLLGAGERAYPGLRSFDNQPFINAHPRWSGTGKDLHDLKRAVDVMEQMPEVDGARIASLGHSQGAGLTCYLAAVDQRIKVGVANCGAYSSRIQNNPFNIARPAWWTGRPALRPFILAGKPLPIDVHELLALAAPRPFLNIVALNDVGFKETDEPLTRRNWEDLQRNVKKVYALHGAGERFEVIMHLDGHDFHDAMRDRAYAFLEHHLGAPN
jgi:dienelactone hydrolase